MHGNNSKTIIRQSGNLGDIAVGRFSAAGLTHDITGLTHDITGLTHDITGLTHDITVLTHVLTLLIERKKIDAPCSVLASWPSSGFITQYFYIYGDP